jgi:DNA-binding HxlR family transcriptional regulator
VKYGGTTLTVRDHRQWTPLARALAAIGDRWTMLIVLALSNDTVRLSVLRTRLPGISAGVLDHHLNRMVALELVSRKRFREMPPRVEVALTDRGSELLPIAASLARWGMRHQWRAPREGDRVRVDAVLRQLPALLEGQTDLPDGIVETVVGAPDDRVSNWFQISDGRLQTAVEKDGEATARIEGDEAAWIAALGPARDCSGLSLAGKRPIAKRLLDSLRYDSCL